MSRDLPRARCWLEVDTDAIKNNLRAVRRRMNGKSELVAVLKADAYGLGIVPVGRLLWANGVRFYAVACLDEAFALRDALPDAWILCMGETLDGALAAAITEKIRLTAGSIEALQRISEAAMEIDKQAYVHVKIDTGLHRIGFTENDCRRIAGYINEPGIVAEGIYTHLALHNRESDEAQHAMFMRVCEKLEALGVRVEMHHVCDSIGLVRYPEWQHEMVRVGALLYGNYPNRYDKPEEIMPVAKFCARVTRVFEVLKGSYVGYDDSHPLERDTKLAALSVGYADGYPRVMSGKGEVLIGGKRAKIVGLICMDQMMADVTDIDFVRQGDVATLLGDEITLREYAATGSLNRNECTAVIGKRVPRIYL